MIKIITAVLLLFATLTASAQQQQAGNAASTDTEGTFQALIDACDDVDALMLRARIRLQLPRTTEEAAAEAESMLEQGFATCGGGDLEGAKKQLAEALAIAEAGAAEKFSAETAEAAAQEVSLQSSEEDTVDRSKDKSPWWKFW